MKPLWLVVPATLALFAGGGALLIASQAPHVSGEVKLTQAPGEEDGPKGPEPTRYGDWERKGIVSDF